MTVSSRTTCDHHIYAIPGKALLTILILVLALLWATTAICISVPDQKSGQPKNVLVLHSFHKDLLWNERLRRGIESVFTESNYPVRIFYEYMDAKRISDNQHIRNLYTLYRHKFNTFNFDAAIITDDQAFQFMRDYHSRLLPHTPVVFCGVNYFKKKDLYGEKNFTGIVQTIDIDETLELALSLNPKTRKAFVVVDKTQTSIAAIQLFIEHLDRYKKRLLFHFNEDMDMDELLNAVGRLSSEWIVIIVNFTIDKSGRTYSLEQSTRLISEEAKVPVYSFWDSYLGNGIIGGKLVSGLAQGELSARMVLDTFNGQPPSKIDVIKKSPNKYMFDYTVLKQFNINLNTLPKGSLIVNKPISFYTEYKTAIGAVILGIIGLSGVIVLLSVNILRRIKAEKHLKEYSNQLEIQNKIDRAILEAKPTEKIASEALQYVRNLFRCKRVSVVLFDYEINEAMVLAVNSEPYTAIGEKSVFPLEAFRADDLSQGKIIYVRDIKAIPFKSKVELALTAESVYSYVRIPLMYHGRLIGALSLGHSDVSVFDPDKVLMVNQISTSLALAIQATIFVNKIVQREKDLKKMSAILIRSQEDERKRISLELHDELGQALTAMNMNLSMLEKKVAPAASGATAIKDLLEEMAGTIKTMSEQVRGLSHELRPPMLDVLGLRPALKSHIKGIQKRTRIKVYQTYTIFDQRFLPDIEINLFRIIQESLHNVVKHSGAKKVFIYLKQKEHSLHLTLQDDGKGFKINDSLGSESGLGMGILGMQERATNLGGMFHIVSHKDSGTRIDVELPLNNNL